MKPKTRDPERLRRILARLEARYRRRDPNANPPVVVTDIPISEWTEERLTEAASKLTRPVLLMPAKPSMEEWLAYTKACHAPLHDPDA